MRALRHLTTAAMTAAALAGCGDDDEQAAPPANPPTTQAAPPTRTESEAPKPPKTTPREQTTVGCLRAAPGVEEVLVKGGDSEDARYFDDLVPGGVTVLAVTLAGEAAELTVFLFDSESDARLAEPDAGGAGLVVTVHGTAVLVAPAKADTDAIERCLIETA